MVIEGHFPVFIVNERAFSRPRTNNGIRRPRKHSGAAADPSEHDSHCPSPIRPSLEYSARATPRPGVFPLHYCLLQRHTLTRSNRMIVAPFI